MSFIGIHSFECGHSKYHVVTNLVIINLHSMKTLLIQHIFKICKCYQNLFAIHWVGPGDEGINMHDNKLCSRVSSPKHIHTMSCVKEGKPEDNDSQVKAKAL